jgi:hypothetical protein
VKAVIEYSRIIRKYFFFPDPRNRSRCSISSRKVEIERIARRAGATEIVHMIRSTTKDLERFGHYDHESAKKMAKEYR